MELQISYSICAKVQKKSVLQRKESRNRKNTKAIMPAKRCRDNRIRISSEISSILEDLQNPMFPKDQISTALAQIISINPFIDRAYTIMKQQLGETEEVTELEAYFLPAQPA